MIIEGLPVDWARVLMAGAYGDALGYAVEFDPWHAIRASYGPRGVEAIDTSGLPASDDTQMTLFCAWALKQAGARSSIETFARRCQEAYLDWLSTQRPGAPKQGSSPLAAHPLMRVRRAPGMTCMSALASIDAGEAAGTPSAPKNISKGCGAAMRAAPIAAAWWWSLEECFQAGAVQGALTHGHVDGWGSSAGMAMMCAALARGVDLKEAVSSAALRCKDAGALGSAACLNKSLAHAGEDIDPAEMSSHLGEGWTGDEAIGIGAWAALRAGSLREAAGLGANHGGDSDSTASIACQLWSLAHPEELGESGLLSSSDLSELCVQAGGWLESLQSP